MENHKLPTLHQFVSEKRNKESSNIDESVDVAGIGEEILDQLKSLGKASKDAIQKFADDFVQDIQRTKDVIQREGGVDKDASWVKDYAKKFMVDVEDLVGLINDEIAYQMANEAAGDVRPLPKEYKHSGMTFQQMDRTNDAAIYGTTDKRNWEVFKVKVAPKTTVKAGGKRVEVPKREKVPGNESFGKWAWSFGKDEQAAWDKFNEIK